MQLIIKGVVHF